MEPIVRSRNYTRAFKNLTVASVLALSLAACSADLTDPRMPVEQAEGLRDQDPHAGFNRAMYRFNTALDKVLIRPISYIYISVVPEPGQKGVSNFLNNLAAPVTFANSVLQRDPQNSFATFWRFVLNTTFGFGGVYDFASEVGLKNRKADFGQTMAMYGVPSGDFLFLPIIGPTTTRDVFGRPVDAAFDPVNYVEPYGWAAAKLGVTIIDARASNMKLIDDTYATSLDPYATFKSGYLQRRTQEVRQAIQAPKLGESAR